MPYETIVLDSWGDERIARITLNRPDRLNAINRQLQDELVDAVERVANDDKVRVVVLTGAGRAFCCAAFSCGPAHEQHTYCEEPYAYIYPIEGI